MVPEVFFGDPAAEYLPGDALFEITLGVPIGVSPDVIYGVIEYIRPACLEAAKGKS